MNDLLLLTGEDIPFPQLRTTIHQPKIFEISLLGENSFYSSCGVINVNKNQIDMSKIEDKSLLDNMTNFEIFMSIMTDRNSFSEQKRFEVTTLLMILFPNEDVIINGEGMFLAERSSGELKPFDANLFGEFCKILNKIACLDESTLKEPEGALASKIARKIAEGKRRKAELMGQKDTKISIISQYSSILSIGTGISLNDIKQYTLYQLFDQFERYQLKYENDIYLKAKIAGAKGMKEAENWMKNIHEK